MKENLGEFEIKCQKMKQKHQEKIARKKIKQIENDIKETNEIEGIVI